MYIYHVFFIHSSIHGYKSYFHILTTVNNSAVNVGVHISFSFHILFSLEKHPAVECWIIWYFYFSKTLHMFSTMVMPIYISTKSAQLNLLSTSLPTPAIFCLFHNSHSDTYEVIFHCGFNLHFPDD